MVEMLPTLSTRLIVHPTSPENIEVVWKFPPRSIRRNPLELPGPVAAELNIPALVHPIDVGEPVVYPQPLP